MLRAVRAARQAQQRDVRVGREMSVRVGKDISGVANRVRTQVTVLMGSSALPYPT